MNTSFPSFLRANLSLLHHKSRIDDFLKVAKKYPDVRVLIVARGLDYAAMVKIVKGTILVTNVRNKKEFFHKESVGYKGYVEADVRILMKILYGFITNLQIIPLMLKRKIKIKGMRELLKFQKLVNVLITKVERKRWKKGRHS